MPDDDISTGDISALHDVFLNNARVASHVEVKERFAVLSDSPKICSNCLVARGTGLADEAKHVAKRRRTLVRAYVQSGRCSSIAVELQPVSQHKYSF